MKVLLATAPDDDSPWNRGSFPPLGLLYLAAEAQKVPGLSIELVDVYSEGLTQEQAVHRIKDCDPDILGITVTSGNVIEACNLITAAKAERPGLTIVAGGVHPTMFDDLMLRELPDLDFVLRGEGDHSFRDLCNRLRVDQGVEGLPGLSYRSNGEIIRGEIQILEDLDALALPDRSLVSPRLYGSQWYGYSLPDLAGRITTACSSRGCPFQCTFCSMVKMCNGRFRARSAASVFKELEGIRSEGFELVIFWDDNFTADRNRVQELCEMIIRNRVGLRFGFAGTLHQLSQSLLDLMHRAGFDLAFVGVESGSDKVLAEYKKPARRNALAAGLQRAKNAHMVTIGSFIAGSPVETPEDFQQTLDWIAEARPHLCDIMPLMVHPGSALWDQLKGTESPATIEASHNRPIWRLPQQATKEEVRGRMAQFRSVFLATYWCSIKAARNRIPEFFDLIVHNKTFRSAVRALFSNLNLVAQFLHLKLR